jgi:TM2 domain-containing membrane protein YozV
MKSKTTAAMLGIFLGGLGGHKFYLGEAGTGVFYLLFCWTLIPSIIGIVQGLNLLGMNQALFDAQYNGRLLAPIFPAMLPGIHQQSTNVVVNVAPPYPVAPPLHQQALAGGDVAARISALHDLKNAGALTEAEFTAAKQKLLATTTGNS